MDLVLSLACSPWRRRTRCSGPSSEGGWKRDYGASVRRLVRDRVDVPLATLFVHVAQRSLRTLRKTFVERATQLYLPLLPYVSQISGELTATPFFAKSHTPDGNVCRIAASCLSVSGTE